MPTFFQFCLLVFAALPYRQGLAQEASLDALPRSGLPLGVFTSFFTSEQDLSISEIRKLYDDGAFVPTASTTSVKFNGLFCWVHLPFVSASSPGKTSVFSMEDTTFRRVEFFLFSGGVLLSQAETGSEVSPEGRTLAIRRAVFQAQLEPQKAYELFVKINTPLNIIHPSIRVFEADDFKTFDHMQQWILGLYYGAALALIFYNLCLFFTTRDLNFFYYVAFISTVFLTLLNLDGMADIFLPGHGWQNHLVTMGNLSILLALNFTRHFLQTRTIAPRIDILLRLAMISCTIGAILPFFEAILHGMLMDINLFVSSLLVIFSGLLAVRSGSIPARYYLLSWLFLSPFCLSWVGMQYGLLPYSYVTIYGIHLGSFIEMILMSVGLGNRLSRIEREKMENLRRAQQSEITASNVKMIAHDVRKPFALLESMLKQIESSQQLDARTVVAEYAPGLRQTMHETNVLLTDLISQNPERKLVLVAQSLRELSETAIKQAMANQLGSSPEITNLIGTEFMVLADRVQLVRVLANLIENAAHAAGSSGAIRLSASVDGPYVVLIVGNTGPAIPPDIQEKMFDLHYTQKVQGTGLGLAIAKDIVAKHGGDLKYHREGDETQFHVRIRKSDDVAAQEYSRDRRTIIVADDCVFMRDAWKRDVTDAAVLTLSHPEAVLDLLKTRSPDPLLTIVVMDKHFDSSQKGEGISAALKIRKLGIPVFISSNSRRSLNDPQQIEKRTYTWRELAALVKKS